MLKQLTFALLLAAIQHHALAASFDCKKAKSKSEVLVCSDPELSAMDDRLHALVDDARRKSDDPAAFKRELVQAWEARQGCKTADCVRQWYALRIARFAMQPAAPLAAPADKPVLAAPSETPAKGSAARGRMHDLARKLGLDAPATKADFLARYAQNGAQCGAGKFRPLKEMYGSAAVTECWTTAPCPSPSEDLKCALVRTAYDAKNRMVIFMMQLQPMSTEPKAGAQALERLMRSMAAHGARAQSGQSATTLLANTEAGLTYQALLVAPPEGSQFAIVSIAERQAPVR